MTGTRHLQPAEGTVAASVSDAVGALELKPEDVATTRLAMKYAQQIDAASGMAKESDVLEKLGPKLLTCLIELGATPRARSAALKPSAPQAGSQLSKLRSARSS